MEAGHAYQHDMYPQPDLRGTRSEQAINLNDTEAEALVCNALYLLTQRDEWLGNRLGDGTVMTTLSAEVGLIREDVSKIIKRGVSEGLFEIHQHQARKTTKTDNIRLTELGRNRIAGLAETDPMLYDKINRFHFRNLYRTAALIALELVNEYKILGSEPVRHATELDTIGTIGDMRAFIERLRAIQEELLANIDAQVPRVAASRAGRLLVGILDANAVKDVGAY